MKISARRLRQVFPFDLSTEDAGRVLTATGLEVEGIERVEDIPGGLRGVVVGHVMEVTPHPDADRLRCAKSMLAKPMAFSTSFAVRATSLQAKRYPLRPSAP